MTNGIKREALIKADWYLWLKHRYVLSTGEPYSFKGYEFFEEITKRKWAPGDQVYFEKPSQVGVSEIAISWLFWLTDRRLKNWHGAAYIFPAQKQLQDHVKARINPLWESDDANPEDRRKYFRERLGAANLAFIKWNGNPIYFRGAQTPKELKSFPADAIVADEFDEWGDPMKAIPTLEARFGASDYGNILGLSTPTIPELGIDAAFSVSNQFNWMVKCDLCYKEFSPLVEVRDRGFEQCVVKAPLTGTVGFLCPFCQDLTQTNGRPGRWIQTVHKDNQKYAYGLSRLFTARHNLKKILSDYEEGLNVQEFYNQTLGMAYTTADARLNRQSIVDLCIGPEKLALASNDATWMGVDVGRKSHWVIGKKDNTGHIHILAYGTVSSMSDLNEIIQRYNVVGCVIDLRPYEDQAKRFINGRNGFFASDFNTGNQEEWFKLVTVDGETGGSRTKIIKNDRTQSCDTVIREIMSKKAFVFPSCVKGDNVFINQLCAPCRIEKENKETGETKARYDSVGKADHYFFALLYLLLAFQVKKSRSLSLGKLW